MMLKAYRDHSMMFKGRVCHYARITSHGKSAVKLANGKATEVHRGLSSMRCYSYRVRWGSSWVFCSPDEGRNVLLQDLIESSGTREGDNAVFVREPCNLFDPSCVKVGLSRDRCVYIQDRCIYIQDRCAYMHFWGGYLEARVAFIIHPLRTLL